MNFGCLTKKQQERMGIMQEKAKRIVQMAKKKGYTLVVSKNKKGYTIITFLNTKNPEFNDIYKISFQPKDFLNNPDIVEYYVTCHITPTMGQKYSKEEFIELIDHRDTLREFCNTLNECDITFPMLEETTFYDFLMEEKKKEYLQNT